MGFAAGIDDDGFADANGDAEGNVGLEFVGEVFLEAFDGFEEALGRRLAVNIIGGIVIELLREVDVGEVLPAAMALGFGDAALDHGGDDGGAEAADAGLDGFVVVAGTDPFVFEGAQENLDDAGETGRARAGLRLAEVLNFFFGQQGVADFFDAVAQGKLGVGWAAEAVLDLGKDAGDAGFERAAHMVTQGDGVDDELAGGVGLRAFFGGDAGDERRAVHQGVEAVIGAAQKALGENDERALGVGEDADGSFHGGAVRAFAIDAEDANAREQEGLGPALFKEVPARHVIKPGAHFAGETAHDQAVLVAAMIGHEDDGVAGAEGSAETVEVHEIVVDYAVFLAQEPRQDVAAHPRPERAAPGRHRHIRFFDDNVLHLGINNQLRSPRREGQIFMRRVKLD